MRMPGAAHLHVRALSLPATVAIASALLLAACGSSEKPTSTPTQSAAPPSASATPKIIGSQRTVLSQLGLNIHQSADESSTVIGTAAQGVVFTVQDYNPSNGGWYKVHGQSTTGWIVADTSLTASGTYQSYSSTERGLSVLIPDTWTFAEEPADVVFRPQQGQQTIVVRTAANTAALGSEAPPGFSSSSSEEKVVCGYTGQVDYFVSGGTAGQASAAPSSASASASPTSSSPHLSNYAVIRLRFDATHTLELAFNYESKDQLSVFQDFYNSISFPFPQCQAPLPSVPAAPAT
jgi:uncharacterized protein YgiM (DUF1202 family)